MVGQINGANQLKQVISLLNHKNTLFISISLSLPPPPQTQRPSCSVLPFLPLSVLFLVQSLQRPLLDLLLFVRIMKRSSHTTKSPEMYVLKVQTPLSDNSFCNPRLALFQKMTSMSVQALSVHLRMSPFSRFIIIHTPTPLFILPCCMPRSTLRS